jgi:hypothetical protein
LEISKKSRGCEDLSQVHDSFVAVLIWPLPVRCRMPIWQTYPANLRAEFVFLSPSPFVLLPTRPSLLGTRNLTKMSSQGFLYHISTHSPTSTIFLSLFFTIFITLEFLLVAMAVVAGFGLGEASL